MFHIIYFVRVKEKRYHDDSGMDGMHKNLGNTSIEFLYPNILVL
jgi:hypothetical protein